METRTSVSHPHVQGSSVSRAVAGAAEGALFGGTVGLMRALINLFREPSPWLVQLAGPVLAGIAVGAIVCSIGRAIANRLLGAWMGSIAGLFLGLFLLGDVFGGYWWTDAIEQTDGTYTTTGRPVGQAIGMVVGGLVGAAVGAFIDRLLRRTNPPSEQQPSQNRAKTE